jgi:hypothetical protein
MLLKPSSMKHMIALMRANAECDQAAALRDAVDAEFDVARDRIDEGGRPARSSRGSR